MLVLLQSPSRSSPPWNTLASFAARTAYGPLPCTWWPRLMTVGAPVVISATWTMPRLRPVCCPAHSRLLYPPVRGPCVRPCKEKGPWRKMTGSQGWTKRSSLPRIHWHLYPTGPIALRTDALNLAVGAVCEQWVGEAWQALSCFSRQLHNSKRKYSSFDGDLLDLFLTTCSSDSS